MRPHIPEVMYPNNESGAQHGARDHGKNSILCVCPAYSLICIISLFSMVPDEQTHNVVGCSSAWKWKRWFASTSI